MDNANSGTRRHRSLGAGLRAVCLKNRILKHIANVMKPVINTIGQKSWDRADVVMVRFTCRVPVALTCTVEDGSNVHDAPCGRLEQLREAVPPPPLRQAELQ